MAPDFVAIDDIHKRGHGANTILLGQFLVVAHVDRADTKTIPFERGDRRLDLAASASRRRSEIEHLARVGLRINLDELPHVIAADQQQHA